MPLSLMKSLFEDTRAAVWCIFPQVLGVQNDSAQKQASSTFVSRSLLKNAGLNLCSEGSLRSLPGGNL